VTRLPLTGVDWIFGSLVIAGILAFFALEAMSFISQWKESRRRRLMRLPGFEVRLTGPMPAGLKERDEDHG